MSSPRNLFVLGGGGALGAFQVGGLLALADVGVLPDGLHGCSAGALNAAFLAAEPTTARLADLARWWTQPSSARLLAPSGLARARGLAGLLSGRSEALLDQRPLRRLVDEHVRAHDLSELAVPITVTTTCLDCGVARHHASGPLADLLVASCALPGLFPPVRLADGHAHVDGGVLCGVPLEAALSGAGPDDTVWVLDCGLAPLTGTPGRCAALPDADDACGLVRCGLDPWHPPVERAPGALDVVLRAFTVARAAANAGPLAPLLGDPRVRVLPHVADAWAGGLLHAVPQGPRDTAQAGELLAAGRAATQQWLLASSERRQAG